MNRSSLRPRANGLIVLAASLGATWGCTSGPICGEGTTLGPDGTTCVGVNPPPFDGECSPGEIFDQAMETCVPFDPCALITCGTPPQGTLAFRKQTSVDQNGGATCTCIADGCTTGWVEEAGFCVQTVACQPGYRQEGNTCLPVEDVSCYEVPQSPLCIPTRCSEQPTAVDGTDLAAEGKCVQDPPPPVEACTNNCHNGIEDPHPWYGGPELSCTGCHGGNAAATSRETAHVPIPNEWQVGSPQWGRPNLRYYLNYVSLIGVEKFDGGLEWLRFANPGDLRVAAQSCGKNSGCHQDRVENTKRSAMATTPGLSGGVVRRVGGPRSVVRGNEGIYKWDTTEGYTHGSGALQALKYDPSITGSTQMINELASINRDLNGAYTEIDLLVQATDKVCGNCHLGSRGGFNFGQRYGDFRGSGCTACHMSYAKDGRSRSLDQMINKNEPSYPAAYAAISNFNVNDLQNLNGAWLGPERSHPTTHRLTKSTVSQRCGSCHFGSNRSDWQYRGYRFDANRDAVLALDNARLNANQVQFTDEIDNNANAFARYHGATQDQILLYEDWNNDGIDDTPADIHYTAGLECVDCHTSGEMHNEIKFVKVTQVSDWNDPSQVVDMSGALWSKQDQATEVECVHCHGNLEYRAVPFEADNRNPIKNLIACAELGETLPNGYASPPECATLGRGRWFKGKYDGRWHYVTQVKDTVMQIGQGAGGGAIRPTDGTEVYSRIASMFHGRVNQDPTDGVGPCINGDPNNCFKDQFNTVQQITPNFSHLGKPATSSVDQMAGGLECYACHSTWIHACFGCHVTFADTDGNAKLYDFSRATGQLTLGQLVQANFGYVDPLAIQFGINSEGKVAQMNPMEKLFLRQIDENNQDFFGTRVLVNNDANIPYNVYRDRAGYGLRQYQTEQLGLPPNADGPLYEQYAQMDLNAGQGFNQIMPHTTQRAWGAMMDCNACHLDQNGDNFNAVAARYGANPTGFGNVSAYLTVMNGLESPRNFNDQVIVFDAAAGFRFDANTYPVDHVVDMQTDWVVNADDGFPLSYNNHPLKLGTPGLNFDPSYSRPWPTMAPTAGPFNQLLLNKVLTEVRANNAGVPLKTGRR